MQDKNLLGWLGLASFYVSFNIEGDKAIISGKDAMINFKSQRQEFRLAVDFAWLLIAWIVSAHWAISSSKQMGATFDEPLYLEQGVEAWHTGKFTELLRVGTMPLPMHVQTFPIWLWEKRTGQQADLYEDFGGWLHIARCWNQIFWGILLLYGWLWARKLAGSWGARLAVTVLALEPSLVAHAGLATTDIAVSGALLAFAFHVYLGLEHHLLRHRVLFPLLWFAIALSCKASALVFGPLIYLVLCLERLAKKGELQPIWPNSTDSTHPEETLTPVEPEGKPSLRARFANMVERAKQDRDPNDPLLVSMNKTASVWQFLKAWTKGIWHALVQRPWVKQTLWIFLGGTALTFFYCGSDFKPEYSFAKWAYSLDQDRWGTGTMRWLADHIKLFHNAGTALVRQIMHNFQGHGVYYLGDVDTRSFRTYFPVLLTLKLPLPILFSPLLLWIFKPRSLNQPVLWIALVLFVFSFNTKVQIGIRMIFPLVAFLIVGLSASWVYTITTLSDEISRKLAKVAVACGLVWLAASMINTLPHGLAYANELWGGKDRIHRYFSDSNLDWGQGLPELVKWSREAQVKNLSVWYFGTDPNRDDIPVHLFTVDANDCADTREKLIRLPGRYLAVSTTIINGSYLHPKNQKVSNLPALEIAELLRKQKPVARTMTFFIYDLEPVVASLTSSGGEAIRQPSSPGATLPR